MNDSSDTSWDERWAETNVAHGIGETGDADRVPMAFGGHGLYVKRCQSEAGAIALPDIIEDSSLWCEVLAIGPNCGQKVSKSHARKYRYGIIEKYGLGYARRSQNLPVDIIGKRCFVNLPWPLVDIRITTPETAVHWEFIIEETLPEAYAD